jgi:hypothetical protein
MSRTSKDRHQLSAQPQRALRLCGFAHQLTNRRDAEDAEVAQRVDAHNRSRAYRNKI